MRGLELGTGTLSLFVSRELRSDRLVFAAVCQPTRAWALGLSLNPSL